MVSISVGGTADITDIPRASSFSISGNTIGSDITVNISRASSAFTHDVIYDLPDGSRRADWSGVTTSKTFTPSMNDCEYITNGTSATAKITVNTYNGSTRIGTTRKTFKIYVPSSVKPSASGLSIHINGTGRDNSIGKYVQNVSKVTASFNNSGTYGSTIKSSKIIIRKDSDNSDVKTISGTSGTTSVLLKNGTYEAITEVVDSRGRTASQQRVTFTVEAYSPPKINSFSASRSSSTTTTVSAPLSVAWSTLGTSNPATVKIDSKSNSGTNATPYNLTGSTAGTVSTTRTITGQSDASSYAYTLTVTDSFGKTASATANIGTSFIEFTISKGKGVGIGKVHERGSLDVAGAAYFKGSVNVNNGWMFDENELRSPNADGSGAKLTDYGNLLPGDNPSGTAHFALVDTAGNSRVKFPFNTEAYEGDQAIELGQFQLWSGRDNGGEGNAIMVWREYTSSNYEFISFDDGTNGWYFNADQPLPSPGSPAGSGNGNLYASKFNVVSDENKKEDFEDYTKSALDQIEHLKTYMYHHKETELRKMVNESKGIERQKSLGLKAQEAPEDILSMAGDSIDLYAMNTLLIKAVQELTQQVKYLDEKIKRR